MFNVAAKLALATSLGTGPYCESWITMYRNVISLFAADRDLHSIVLLPEDSFLTDCIPAVQVSFRRQAEWQLDHHASGKARTPLLLCVDLAPNIPGPPLPFERT